jgi:hypothetical protein
MGCHSRNPSKKKARPSKTLRISDYVILLSSNEDVSRAAEHWPVRQQLCIENES